MKEHEREWKSQKRLLEDKFDKNRIAKTELNKTKEKWKKGLVEKFSKEES